LAPVQGYLLSNIIFDKGEKVQPDNDTPIVTTREKCLSALCGVLSALCMRTKPKKPNELPTGPYFWVTGMKGKQIKVVKAMNGKLLSQTVRDSAPLYRASVA